MAEQQEPPASTSEQPLTQLEKNLQNAVAQSRAILTSETRFDKTDFAALAEQAIRVVDQCSRAGVAEEPLRRIVNLSRIMLHLAGEPQPEIVSQPTETETFLASAEIGDLSFISHRLATPKSPWLPLLNAMLAQGPEHALAASHARIAARFASSCKASRIKVAPGPGVDAHELELDLDGWRIGVASSFVKKPEPSSNIDAATEAQEKLSRGEIAGLALLDMTNTAWPERRVIAAPNDATALAEINARLDRQLLASEDEISRSIDNERVFGIVGAATIPTMHKLTGAVAFTTGTRIMPTCAEGDPRQSRLIEFAGRLTTTSP